MEKRKELFPSSFDRGHLAPNSDFMFKDWQEATFFYANTAPQWPAINRGNWKEVEDAVRSLALREEVELEVITGTKDVLAMDRKQVWLAKEEETRKKLVPVPKVLWKIVTEPKTSKSIVVITLNNPSYKRVTKVQMFCPDICEETGWAEEIGARKAMTEGFTFCCSLQEFRKVVPWIPYIHGNSILNFNDTF